MICIKDLPIDKLILFVKNMGEPEFRAKQIFYWLHKKGVGNFNEMSNLSLFLREKLKEIADISTPTISKEVESKDGTKKYLFLLHDNNYIESVFLKDEKNITFCISTQVGCKLACAYCQTGKGGYVRNLRVSEIVDQVILLKGTNNIPENKSINLVFMGMGEPLDNYDNLVCAIDILLSKDGQHIPQRRITLSTAGLPDDLIRFCRKFTNINIALSLNASKNETRSALMPINKKYPLIQIIKTIKSYLPKSRRGVTIEYVMIDKVNDYKDDAENLARILKGVKCKINLIPINAITGSPFKPSPMNKVLAFQNILREKNFLAFIRKSKGADIMAACGQLSSKVEK